MNKTCVFTRYKIQSFPRWNSIPFQFHLNNNNNSFRATDGFLWITSNHETNDPYRFVTMAMIRQPAIFLTSDKQCNEYCHPFAFVFLSDFRRTIHNIFVANFYNVVVCMFEHREINRFIFARPSSFNQFVAAKFEYFIKSVHIFNQNKLMENGEKMWMVRWLEWRFNGSFISPHNDHFGWFRIF